MSIIKASFVVLVLFELWNSSGATPSNSSLPRDCADIREQGKTTSGVYTVNIGVGDEQRPLDVYCDMTTDSFAWTVFQRRQGGIVCNEDFNRNWADYKTGFGNISGEFWIGNDNLHLLTSSKRYTLRVELKAFNRLTAFAEFDNFKVANAADNYTLTSIGEYFGTAGGESLKGNVGKQFSTWDQDNDVDLTNNLADQCKGGWWYYYGGGSNLNGHYYKRQTIQRDSMYWYHLKSSFMSLKQTEMKLTPFV